MIKFFEVKNNCSQRLLIEKIQRKLRIYSFCLVKNFNTEKTQSRLSKIVRSRYQYNNDIRVSGKRKIGSNDYQRVDLGDSYKNIRFMRVISFAEWNKKNKEFFELVNPIISLRNKLSKIEKIGMYYPKVDKIQLRKEKKNYFLCDFVRMIQYPKGGGFLIRHNDYDEQYGKDVVAALLPLTTKKNKKNSGRSATYEKGGLYFIHKNKKVMIDDYVENGDLVLFNAKIDHGVNTIDPHKKVDIAKLSGRLTLNFSVASFYK